jgi:hypothetical protein
MSTRTAAAEIDRVDRSPVLRLLAEAKVPDLVGDGTGHYEASGVLAYAGWYWVIFDNMPHVARIDPGLAPGDPRSTLIRQPGRTVGYVGYEDIAHDATDGRFFLLVEAVRRGSGFVAEVRELDSDLRPLATRWLDVRLEWANKGLEGLSFVRRAGRAHLLGLCEGNFGLGGKQGRRPGGGRLHVFGEGSAEWERIATIHLPESLWFADYSGISVAGDRVAVVSQESSALWVGRLAPSSWELLDAGTTYVFPRDERGRIRYGTVEGVSWLSEDEVVVVSDRAKPNQPHRFHATDQSVHRFALPASASPAW